MSNPINELRQREWDEKYAHLPYYERPIGPNQLAALNGMIPRAIQSACARNPVMSIAHSMITAGSTDKKNAVRRKLVGKLVGKDISSTAELMMQDWAAVRDLAYRDWPNQDFTLTDEFIDGVSFYLSNILVEMHNANNLHP